MSWTYEIALRGELETARALHEWLSAGARQALTRLPELVSLDLYTPAEGPAHDPHNRDAGGPLMMLMFDFASRDVLAKAVEAGDIVQACSTLPTGIAATGAAFERRFYPAGDAQEPAPLQASFSYVVRYHRPADDEAAFIANYIATHPATQARLPGIRAIMCYLPLHDIAVQPEHGLTAPDYLIGNEVVFDDIDAFNLAMASPVRQELRHDEAASQCGPRKKT
ncbi:MAG: hypothetical protein P8Y53_11000 [Pseudolabrys sp.]